MNVNDSSTGDFFYLYDQKLKNTPELENNKKLLYYYFQIKFTYYEKLWDLKKENYLESLRETLLCDAKLQILFFFWCDIDLFDRTEEDIIKIVETDSKFFYKEALRISHNKIPIPFIFRF